MQKQISPKIVSLVFSVLVVAFLAVFYVLAWTEPTEVPPGGNVPAPLNVSDNPQQKTGSLRLGGLTVDSETYLAVDSGNVGIGTTSPGEKLEVSGNIKLSGASPNYKVTNVSTPTDSSDVATKGYVDAQAGGGGACYTTYGGTTCATGYTAVVSGYTTIYYMLAMASGYSEADSLAATGDLVCSPITHAAAATTARWLRGTSKYNYGTQLDNEPCRICCK